MVITVPNDANLSADELRSRVNDAVTSDVAREYKVKATWKDPFSLTFTAQGVSKGEVTLSYAGGVRLYASLKWGYGMFEGKIRAALEAMIKEQMRAEPVKGDE